MIVLARLEAEHSDLAEVIAELDKAQEAISPVLTEGTVIHDEHYERMAAGETHPPYFKGRRVFKIASITTPRPLTPLNRFAGAAVNSANLGAAQNG